MKYKITATLPKQGATRLEEEQGIEAYFTYQCENKKEALARIHSILTRGVSQSFDMPNHHLIKSQTVFYPAHLVKRISVEPPIPDFD